MADNFNLRSFLSENKLTKNAKLLSENVDIAQVFSQAGITGEVTVVFYSDDGMGEPEFEVMSAQNALAMITSEAQQAEEEQDVIIAQGDEIDQQGTLNPETQGLECLLEVAILDHGTYEIYQGSNEENLDEASFSDSYDTPASMAVYRQLTSIVNIFKKSGQEEREELDAVISAAEQETGTQVTPVERNTLHRQLRWIRTHSMEMEREGVENEKPVLEASYKVSKNSKEAQHLKKGDIIGSGDEVVSVSAGAKTPAGKVEVTLKTKNGDTKTSLYGKTTKIGLKKVEESKLTAKEQALVEMVQNALGIAPQAVAEEAPMAEEIPMAEDEMVNEKPLPKYENIEKLMQEIDKSTDEAAHKYKMEEMKRVADMLEKKCTALEEGEDSDHIDQKKLKQMKKDIMTLRRGIEKMEKLAEKKFASKKETKEEK